MAKRILHIMTSAVGTSCFIAVMCALFGAGLMQAQSGLAPIFLYLSFGLAVLRLLTLLLLILLDPVSRVLLTIRLTRSVSVKVGIFYERLLPLLREQLPRTLYRYVALGGPDGEDEKRLRSLEADALWFSRADRFNDHFEGVDLRYSNLRQSDEALEDIGALEERKRRLGQYLTEARRDFLICSFSKSYRISPMWAHYAGNHRGFCIQYGVENTQALFGVEYNTKKPDVGPRMEKLEQELAMGDITRMEYEEILRRNHKLWCVLKSKDWAYEQEVRAILTKKIYPYPGKNIPSAAVGLKIQGIYLGYACTEEDRARLREIAAKLGIFCREVEPDYSGNFSVMKAKDEI